MLIRLSKYLHAWTARKSNLKCVKLMLQLLWSNVKHSVLGLNDWEDWQSFKIHYQSFSQCGHCFPQWTPHHTLELSTSRRRLNTSLLAAFSLLSLRLYKLFQCNGIILSFFLLQFLCITKAQGRIFTMKTWALCITRPALCFSTQDWNGLKMCTLTGRRCQELSSLKPLRLSGWVEAAGQHFRYVDTSCCGMADAQRFGQQGRDFPLEIFFVGSNHGDIVKSQKGVHNIHKLDHISHHSSFYLRIS